MNKWNGNTYKYARSMDSRETGVGLYTMIKAECFTMNDVEKMLSKIPESGWKKFVERCLMTFVGGPFTANHEDLTIQTGGKRIWWITQVRQWIRADDTYSSNRSDKLCLPNRIFNPHHMMYQSDKICVKRCNFVKNFSRCKQRTVAKLTQHGGTHVCHVRSVLNVV